MKNQTKGYLILAILGISLWGLLFSQTPSVAIGILAICIGMTVIVGILMYAFNLTQRDD
jgi:hypothetical protein